MHSITIIVLLVIQITASVGQVPRLAVIVSFDQYRGDFPKKFSRFVGMDGFNRIVTEGSVFTKCLYNHGNTSTAPGHATLLTGSDPYRTGITSNYFCDNRTDECGYCSSDSVDFVSPAKLESVTIGDLLKAKYRKSKVVGLSIKDRAAVMMSGHEPNAVVWIDSKTKNFVTSSYYKTPSWLSLIKQLSDPKKYAGEIWNTVIPDTKQPAQDDVMYEGTMSTNRRTFPYQIPDFDTKGFFPDFLRSPFSMECLFKAAITIIQKEQLGKDKYPDLLCIGISTTDYTGHTFGPDSREVQELYVHADKLIGNLIDVLDKNIGRKKYVLVVTSDHGVSSIPELLNIDNMPGRPRVDAGRYRLSTIVHGIDSVLNNKFGMPPDSTWVALADEPSIFFDGDTIDSMGVNRKAIVDAACAWLKSLPGIGILARRDRMLLGDCPDEITDDECQLLRNGFHPTRSGDVMIFPKRYWVITGDAASHGSIHDYDRWVPLMMLGGPVKNKTSSASVSPTDIAPTLAEMWRLEMPPCDGKPLPLK